MRQLNFHSHRRPSGIVALPKLRSPTLLFGERRKTGLRRRLRCGKDSSMTELEQLEQQVLQLSPADLAKFRAWFTALDHQIWDKQVEADAKAGKLDHLIKEARAELKAGKAREL